MSFAVIGLILGLVEMVGWIVFFAFAHAEPRHLFMEADLATDAPPIENLDPVLKRAMSASVVLEVSHGRLIGAAAGSGVILELANDHALLVTNRHVVDPLFTGDGKDANNLDDLPPVKVRFIDQTEGAGKVVWMAPSGIDLALVRVPGPSSKAMAALWTAHRPVRIADPVFAIGNPHRLGWTHTQGAVSQLRIQLVNGHKVRLIQTQTAINPGNSGGGLFDKEGYLIGIATWTSDKRLSEGLNFAISLDALVDSQPAMLPMPPGK
jgi:serine protease Do